jgi:ADP-ribose pyrophosphatase YjhB (NUDIX family)
MPFPDHFSQRIPDGDDKPRTVCDTCGWVHYVNPKIVVGSVVVHDGKILLCRRAIEPRKGYWTLPAGYLEERETTEAGAMREAREEANAEIALDGILAVYNVPRISQVQIMYRARLVAPDIAPGPESLEVGLFAWDDIPWRDLAFPSVHWALNAWAEVKEAANWVTRGNPPGELGNYAGAGRRD